MSPINLGYLVGSVLGAVLIPITVFLILRNLLSITPLKIWIRTIHSVAGGVALLLTLAVLRGEAGVLLFPVALTTTSLFIRRSYRKAKAEKLAA